MAYLTRWDLAAAMTVFPVWLWVLPGLLALVSFLWRRNPRPMRRCAGIGAILWLICGLFLPDEPTSVMRGIWRVSDGGAQGTYDLRVVSLNCAGGDSRAAEEVIAQKPDVVLLQECPTPIYVKKLARKLFGKEAAWLTALDPAIIVRGKLEPLPLPRDLQGSFVRGRATFPDGRSVDLVSLRLTPAVLRMDLWSLDRWQTQMENRQARRTSLIDLKDALGNSRSPLIIGGDFNAPQGDGAIQALAPRLRDAFREAGVGWGNTIMNDLPLLRIDQVWISRELTAHAANALHTRFSDHRMVVCDLRFRHE
jgi:endonuclease/exonuclease/phosphatase (EEP) superfamily protein YafD